MLGPWFVHGCFHSFGLSMLKAFWRWGLSFASIKFLFWPLSLPTSTLPMVWPLISKAAARSSPWSRCRAVCWMLLCHVPVTDVCTSLTWTVWSVSTDNPPFRKNCLSLGDYLYRGISSAISFAQWCRWARSQCFVHYPKLFQLLTHQDCWKMILSWFGLAISNETLCSQGRLRCLINFTISSWSLFCATARSRSGLKSSKCVYYVVFGMLCIDVWKCKAAALDSVVWHRTCVL